jgi:hypothetical protein
MALGKGKRWRRDVPHPGAPQFARFFRGGSKKPHSFLTNARHTVVLRMNTPARKRCICIPVPRRSGRCARRVVANLARLSPSAAAGPSLAYEGPRGHGEDDNDQRRESSGSRELGVGSRSGFGCIDPFGLADVRGTRVPTAHRPGARREGLNSSHGARHRSLSVHVTDG